jgi:hypothetical protein
MAETTSGTLGTGAGIVWRRQRVLWWIFIVNALLAVFGTRGIAMRLGETLDHSLASQRLVHGFDVATFANLSIYPGAPLSPSTPEVIHFGIVFFFFMLLVTGGILEAYLRDTSPSTTEFFRAGAHCFWRFFRLLIYFAIVVGIIGAIAFGVDSLSDAIDNRWIPDMRGFWVELIGGLIVLFLMMAVRLWFDMAQIHAIAQDDTRMFRMLREAGRFTRRNFGSLFWLYFRISFVAWAGFALGLWVWYRFVGPTHVGVSIFLGQILVLFWLWARLWQRASETVWYQDHQTALEPAPAPLPTLQEEGAAVPLR